ncbi:hypothetical protein [Myxacorys almedinensis]|uniref:Uncharacterized protein n=1 Tax=Myxacorys almedinensis A TaxID=2690445 RepID=A0A8J7YWQ7_9CYAN|nr:hypothetical protein [Myxacorys almedinensis]NDJ16019.1 hypothetical protein [Myxacorys almedinensis A]
MKRNCLKLILIFAVICVLSPCPVAANAPAPPPYLWFTFLDQPAVEGMQLIGCQTALCEKPTLLMQHGTCVRSSCLKAQPRLEAPHRFECAADRCLYQGVSLQAAPLAPYLKLIGQFQNRVRSSQAFVTDFRNPLAGYAARHLLVRTQNEELLVFPDRQAMKPSRWELSGRALAITQVSEVGIAAVFFVGKKFTQTFTVRVLSAIALINLFTFPVVWFFFPSLQPFEYRATRVLGATSLLIAIAFSAALARMKTTSLNVLIRIFTIWVIALPIALVIGFIAAFLVGYGESFPASAGIPRWVTLPVSGGVAIAAEAWLLARLSHPHLSPIQAGLVSLVMNASSVWLNLAVLPALR